MDLDDLIKEYGIDVNSTAEIEPGIYEVNEISNTYIIDNFWGMKIACHPHLVGTEFGKFNYNCAEESAKAIKKLAKLHKGSLLHLHILRAAPGYELHRFFDAPEIWIRPRYTKVSYRDHYFEDKKIEIMHRNFQNLPKNKELTVLVPDTIASGRSVYESIKELTLDCEGVSSSIKRIVLYGFISLDGLKIIEEFTEQMDIELLSFAIGSITPLASNRYDMPLYGIDLEYWEKNGKIKNLGGIVDMKTLERWSEEYVPGCDQPGDFSARQLQLFNGIEMEDGNIREHLLNSIEMIEKIREVPLEPWQEKIAELELKKLKESLNKY